MKFLTRTIWLLGLTSLFTDAASEMLYPVMPIFLLHIGFSVVAIGILEGVAEAVASLSKGYFGRMSDATGKRLPFVRLGYAVSAISKPLMGIIMNVPAIFAWRTLDRLGKGLRTAPRDALLSSESSPETKGRVFGFHRGMDTLGAVLGPLIALSFLAFRPEHYRALFWVALLPGMAAVLCTLLLKEKAVAPRETSGGFFAFLKYWTKGPAAYRSLVVALVMFALVNSSDVFLLLMIKSRGYSDPYVIGIYIFYNLVYAVMSYPIGALGDRIGLARMLVLGLLLFAAVYAGVGYVDSLPAFLGLFFLYGVYAACSEGMAKALVCNLVPQNETATAIGLFTSLQGVAALVASSLAGWIWYAFSPQATFMVSAGGALFVAVWLAIKVPMIGKKA